MASTVTIDLRHIARGLEVSLHQIQAVVELLDEGNTIPFITRYRKDQTGGMDEEQIREIHARLGRMRLLVERKQTILRSIEGQGKLTEKLAQQIQAAATTKRLEDLYLPYKPKKQTLATLARTRGLEELAHEILAAAPTCADLNARARDFANPDRQVPSGADALLGAGHILAEEFSERADLRQHCARSCSGPARLSARGSAASPTRRRARGPARTRRRPPRRRWRPRNLTRNRRSRPPKRRQCPLNRLPKRRQWQRSRSPKRRRLPLNQLPKRRPCQRSRLPKHRPHRQHRAAAATRQGRRRRG